MTPIAQWCDSSSIEPLHSTKFGKELTRLGYETFKAKRGNGRIGIGLKQSPATTQSRVRQAPVQKSCRCLCPYTHALQALRDSL